MAYVTDHSDPTGRTALVPVDSSPNFINPNFVHIYHLQQLYRAQLARRRALIAQIELKRSITLQQLIRDEGLVPSQEEEQRRNNVIRKLREIVMNWIKKVAHLRNLSRNQIRAASATILTYGSYGLGVSFFFFQFIKISLCLNLFPDYVQVHNADSDIDALCVAPCFASLTDDFFIELHNMLAKRVEVSDIHCIKDAKVPLMRFKFDGISIDLPYAQLQVTTVPENVDILNSLFINKFDETSWKSLSGVRANNSILRLVPNVKIFQELLRCVKLWAKRRDVYGNLFGFFGGVHLAVLSAFICQRHPNVMLAPLVWMFFMTFAFWPWPTPVILHGTIVPRHRPERRSLMPIQLPNSPHECCHSNITETTFRRIKQEFFRGFSHIQDLLKAQFDWRNLFLPYPYSKNYQKFIKITISSCKKDELGDWVGWVKSRFRCLIVKLEELHAICDPNPNDYCDTSIQDPNVVYYWGLNNWSNDELDLDLVQKEFKKNLRNGFKGITGNITLSVIQTSELPKNLDLDAHHLHSNSSQI